MLVVDCEVGADIAAVGERARFELRLIARDAGAPQAIGGITAATVAAAPAVELVVLEVAAAGIAVAPRVLAAHGPASTTAVTAAAGDAGASRALAVSLQAVTLGRRTFATSVRSRWARTAMTVGSSQASPTICRPTGMPSGAIPTGAVPAGSPARFARKA